MNEKNKKRVNIDKKTLIMLVIDIGVVMGSVGVGMAAARTIEASRRPEDRLATLIRLWERGVIQLKDGDHVLTDEETAVTFSLMKRLQLHSRTLSTVSTADRSYFFLFSERRRRKE